MMAFAFMYTCVMYYIKLSIIHVDNWKDPLYSMHSKVMLCLFIYLQHLLSMVLSGSTDNRTRGPF